MGADPPGRGDTEDPDITSGNADAFTSVRLDGEMTSTVETTLEGEPPDLIPARMINEAAYCSRLFYLEWVQSQFQDNADTTDGSWKHRVVDKAEGAVPEPSEVDQLHSARCVLLSSERLGLIGKIDLLQQEGGSVIPVDYKRGRTPSNPERSWEPERVQLCTLGLILRDNGYRCDHGTLWFAESRERVEIPFTEALVERTMAIVEEMRTTARAGHPPPPLVDSPKCPRCSLVGICLPDEHNFLASRSSGSPRRLVPSADAARPLYVAQHGAVVGVRAGRIEVAARDRRLASIRPIDVSQICVMGNVQVTTQALRECFALEVPVMFMSGGGWLLGIADGLPSKNVDLRMRQLVVAGRGDAIPARDFISGKIRNSRTLLRRNGRPAPDTVLNGLAEAAKAADAATGAASLLGIEGAAARSYFGAFSTMLRSDVSLPGSTFSFAGRNRRPPRDPVNCLLSFAYALLTKDLLAACLAVGFDPYIGLFHRPRYGRPALALDLAEEFRPIIADSVVLQVVNNGEVAASDFVVRGGGVALTADGRKSVLAAYERRLDVEVTHPIFKYKVTYRRVLEVQARLLGAWLLGEVPSYVPFVTR